MSFRTKVQLETNGGVIECSASNDITDSTDSTDSKQNEEVDVIRLSTATQTPPLSYSFNTLTRTDRSDFDTVSQLHNVYELEKSAIVIVDGATLSVDLEQIESLPIPEGLVMDPMTPTALAVPDHLMGRIGSGLSILRDHGKKVQKYLLKNRKFEVLKKSWTSIVNIVLIEAKDLPDVPSSTNGLYCKFKLGNESHKSKQVHKNKPIWRERFNLYLYEENTLEVNVWHKTKQKNFMGRCVIDLSQLEKEKTHDLWQSLECGFGSVHLLVTLSGSDRCTHTPIPDDVIPSNGTQHIPTDDQFVWYKLDNWNEVGRLSVKVLAAKGLSALNISGNVNAFCVLELDNSRIQTHTIRGTTEPNWNKKFNFCINDITSALDITVYDEAMLQSMKGEKIGKVSIPLLRIKDNEKKWYALKDRSKRSSARGNCPRILLEMSLVWNPIKASVRVLSPKETKYIQKPTKFDIPLIYSNLLFIKDIFKIFQNGHEYLKRVFEWENQEKSALALAAWLTFWYFFSMWMTPLLLLLPFGHFWLLRRNSNAVVSVSQLEEENYYQEEEQDAKDDKTIKTRFSELQDLTLTIKNGIDYIVSLLERIKNLVNFSVPYLSCLVIIALIAAAIAFYIIPVNYLFMAFGVYKFSRKILNPRRVPNNDILDFISRVPDDEMLKQWRELKVPEPTPQSDSTKSR